MYKIATINTKDLSKIKISHQDKILELTGSKLDPLHGYEIIKKASKGFTTEDPKARQADELFYELLQRDGGVKKTASEDKTKVEDAQYEMQMRERERARRLRLLALELELESAG
jgi:hypothetical protein